MVKKDMATVKGTGKGTGKGNGKGTGKADVEVTSPENNNKLIVVVIAVVIGLLFLLLWYFGVFDGSDEEDEPVEGDAAAAAAVNPAAGMSTTTVITSGGQDPPCNVADEVAAGAPASTACADATEIVDRSSSTHRRCLENADCPEAHNRCELREGGSPGCYSQYRCTKAGPAGVAGATTDGDGDPWPNDPCN